MSNVAIKYLNDTCTSFGEGWNRFWFARRDPKVSSVIRIIAGAIALWWMVGAFLDSQTFFGPDGAMPESTVQTLMGVVDTTEDDSANASPVISIYRVSHLIYPDSEVGITIFHLLAIFAAVAFAVGLASRISAIATLTFLVLIIHRAPILTGDFETILCMGLTYLCIAPTGAVWSIDEQIRRRLSKTTPATRIIFGSSDKSVTANLSLRLIQLHLSLVYFMMFIAQLSLGNESVFWPWLNGEALWWMIADAETRKLDLVFLHKYPYLYELWTYFILAVELASATLIWNRRARPILIVLGAIMWLSISLISAHLTLGILMVGLSLAFVTLNDKAPSEDLVVE